ncbi:MAG: hypothetical protein LH473_06265 [Chitinophagales bacterium]|nr:hypothetical protein [Chitinophagales bacterium]
MNSISKRRPTTDHITCRLPITLKKKLEALAIKKNSNLNQLIKSAVEDFVEMKYEKKINEVKEEQQLLQNQFVREKNINIDLQKQISQVLALLKEAKLAVKNLEESKIILEKTLQTNSTQIIELKANFDKSQSDLIKVLIFPTI